MNNLSSFQRFLDTTQHSDIYDPQTLPSVSIILPLNNQTTSLNTTLQSVCSQKKIDFELLCIDSEIETQTAHLVKQFDDPRIKLLSSTNNRRYEMLNKGIIHARGRYINILFPSEHYLKEDTLYQVMEEAMKHRQPDLLYYAGISRPFLESNQLIFYPLQASFLQKGLDPIRLRSCWFRRDLFEKIGKFRTTLNTSGAFDLFCRISAHSSLHVIGQKKVLVDGPDKPITRKKSMLRFVESAQIIYHRFGILALWKWIWHQRELMLYLQSFLKNLRLSFYKKL